MHGNLNTLADFARYFTNVKEDGIIGAVFFEEHPFLLTVHARWSLKALLTKDAMWRMQYRDAVRRAVGDLKPAVLNVHLDIGFTPLWIKRVHAFLKRECGLSVL